jgi:hypothetical protein
MLLKTKDGRGKLCAEAGMYMKTKEMRVESGNVIEKKGCYSLSIADCRLNKWCGNSFQCPSAIGNRQFQQSWAKR